MDQRSLINYDAQKAVETARSYIGTRWRHRGRSRYGIDCIGLIVASLKAAGFTMRDRVDYGREPWRDGLEREMHEHFGDPIPRAEWRAGDVAMMRWENRPEAGHVGLIAQGPHGLTLIHSHSMSSVIEHHIDAHWESLILAVFRP